MDEMLVLPLKWERLFQQQIAQFTKQGKMVMVNSAASEKPQII